MFATNVVGANVVALVELARLRPVSKIKRRKCPFCSSLITIEITAAAKRNAMEKPI